MALPWPLLSPCTCTRSVHDRVSRCVAVCGGDARGGALTPDTRLWSAHSLHLLALFTGVIVTYLLLAQTWYFKAGLFGMLAGRFRGVFVLTPLYFLIMVGSHALRIVRLLQWERARALYDRCVGADACAARSCAD